MWNKQKIDEEKSSNFSYKTSYTNFPLLKSPNNHFIKKNYFNHPKVCSYRYQSKCQQNQAVIVLSNIRNIVKNNKQKRCKYSNFACKEEIIKERNSEQFSTYIQTFYQEEFLNKFSNVPSLSSISVKSNSSSSFVDCKINEEDINISTPLFLSETQFHNKYHEDVLQSITYYLNAIKPSFMEVLQIPSQSEIIKLQVKAGCEELLRDQIIIIFKQFLQRARENKHSNNTFVSDYIQKTDSKKSVICKKRKRVFENSTNEVISEENNYFKNKEDEILSQLDYSEEEEEAIADQQKQNNESKKTTQSKYHNLKNSFMQLIIQLFCPEVLKCFELPQYIQQNAELIIHRMKENSFKYRPIKGKYQYYSNMHYLTLFLKYTEKNFNNLKSDPQMQEFHKIFYQENIQERNSVTDIEIIKCNYYKSLIGQISTYCLEIAEKQLNQNISTDGSSCKLPSQSSRYFYINKVKKGISKLQNGKQIIRF